MNNKNERVKERANKKGAKIKKIEIYATVTLLLAYSFYAARSLFFRSPDPANDKNRKRVEYSVPPANNNEINVVYGDYVRVETAGERLSIRDNPSIYGKPLSYIENGTIITRLLRSGESSGADCDVYNEDDWDVVLVSKGEGKKPLIGYVFRGYIENANDLFISEYDIQKDYSFVENAGDEPVHVRYSPSSNMGDTNYITSIPAGMRARVIGRIFQSNWILISYDGKIGFADGDNLSKVDYLYKINQLNKTMYVNADGVNLRTDAGTNYSKFTKLDKNTELKICGIKNGFYIVDYNGRYLYISSSFVSSGPNMRYRDDIMFVGSAVTSLKVTDDHGKEIYQMSNGEVCEVLGQFNSLFYVRVGGVAGFVQFDKIMKLSGTFVVVDISEQKFTMYQDNKILVEESIDISNDSIKGKFKIADVEFERTLDGKTEIKYNLRTVNSDKRRTATITGSDIVRQVTENFKGDFRISK